MFVEALRKAIRFTLPVVLSERFEDGHCEAQIGAFVVINQEGWAVTAGHIVTLDAQNAEAVERHQQGGTSRRARRRRQQRAKPNTVVTVASAWWGWDKVQRVETHSLNEVDLALVKLEPFEPEWVTEYPVFKNPKDLPYGRSLCRLGFPFHSITPIYHENTQSFQLPSESMPIPFFPNDGIYTRELVLPEEQQPAPGYPLRFIETSSPGLRGQSGRPIFDMDGSVWAIQTDTTHHPLGFTPPDPRNPSKTVSQFMHVGRGVHPLTLTGAMDQLRINYQPSAK